MNITFSQSTTEVEAYDFVEVIARITNSNVENPFTGSEFKGSFTQAGQAPVEVEGFCDAFDGSMYRIRFMPVQEGEYSYYLTLHVGEEEQTYEGTFCTAASTRKGLLRVNEAHPWHFVWQGTGEHYFWNGTTTYFLMGWDDETIRQSVDRLHRLGVNRLRVALTGRVHSGQQWGEPINASENFRFTLNPWVAERPDDVDNPGFDVTRFDVEYWQKYERLLAYARERDVIISVIFYVDGAVYGTDPFKEQMGGEDEQRYYRYAAARLSAYSNVLWDITNEYHLFRNEEWTEKMGAFLKSCDPYHHLMSVHGHGEFPFRTSPWADFAMYQAWDEGGGHGFMLHNRKLQIEAGKPMPQINEEYGYEDHYPQWGAGKVAPARSADNRRRLAWEISMAGGYQTTGERCDNGVGGWINGAGDDSMIMLHGYKLMVDFFARLPWWELEPRDELVTNGAQCLAREGERYVVYLPSGGNMTLQLQDGNYTAQWFNPRSGEYSDLPAVEETSWTSPDAPDGEDWVLLLQK